MAIKISLIGAGNIGGIVCERARALQMKVLAYDPFLGEEKAESMGVEKVELNYYKYSDNETIELTRANIEKHPNNFTHQKILYL